jgi:hypothetical protein
MNEDNGDGDAPSLRQGFRFVYMHVFGIGVDYSFLLLSKRSEIEEPKEEEEGSDGCSEVQAVS